MIVMPVTKRRHSGLDRRGAPRQRKKRGMHVQAAQAQQVQDGITKDLPEGCDDDDHVRRPVRHDLGGIDGPQPGGLEHVQARARTADFTGGGVGPFHDRRVDRAA
jgi:hypothetical protein